MALVPKWRGTGADAMRLCHCCTLCSNGASATAFAAGIEAAAEIEGSMVLEYDPTAPHTSATAPSAFFYVSSFSSFRRAMVLIALWRGGGAEAGSGEVFSSLRHGHEPKGNSDASNCAPPFTPGFHIRAETPRCND